MRWLPQQLLGSCCPFSPDYLKSGKASSPLRVLVADDHPYIGAGMSGDVNAQGDMLVVAEARDGIEALELFHKYRPDVSLVGLRMPKLDGIEVVASIAY